MKPAKHPGGRPPKPTSERASSDINIRTTKATKAKLKAAAKALEVTLSAFVLSAAVDKADAQHPRKQDTPSDAPTA